MEPAIGQPLLRPTDRNDIGIILFDGDCAMCSRLVSFIWRRDPLAYLRYAPLQSEAGRRLLSKHAIPAGDTVVLIEGSTVFTQSTAVLRIARHLRWPWKLLSALLLIPAPLRDPIYAAIARRRYRWFGKQKRCSVLPFELKDRSLH